MRSFVKLAIGLTLPSVMAFSASADIVNSDWLEEGDGLTFTNVTTGMVFLDLSETFDMSINDVEALLDTTFEGFSIATGEQAAAALSSMLEDSVGYSTTMGTTYTSLYNRYELADITGAHIGAGGPFIYGIAVDEDISMYGVYASSTYTSTVYNNNVYNENYSFFSHGVWLVRDSSVTDAPTSFTDLPAPLAFFGLALLGLGAIRRKKEW
jgi:hypothetical protein